METTTLILLKFPLFSVGKMRKFQCICILKMMANVYEAAVSYGQMVSQQSQQNGFSARVFLG